MLPQRATAPAAPALLPCRHPPPSPPSPPPAATRWSPTPPCLERRCSPPPCPRCLRPPRWPPRPCLAQQWPAPPALQLRPPLQRPSSSTGTNRSCCGPCPLRSSSSSSSSSSFGRPRLCSSTAAAAPVPLRFSLSARATFPMRGPPVQQRPAAAPVRGLPQLPLLLLLPPRAPPRPHQRPCRSCTLRRRTRASPSPCSGCERAQPAAGALASKRN